jgi:hypothetical protein
MITPSYVQTMSAYNGEMNHRLFAAASRLTDSERRADRGPSLSPSMGRSFICCGVTGPG